MRLAQLLSDHLVPFATLIHAPAFTAQRRAKYLGIPGRRVAKTVLLRGPAGWLLAILPANRQLDLEKVASAVGGPVRLADESELAQVFTDCEYGIASPLGSRYGVPTYLDDSLAPDALLVFEMQYRHEAVQMRCSDFERLELPRRLDLSC